LRHARLGDFLCGPGFGRHFATVFSRAGVGGFGSDGVLLWHWFRRRVGPHIHLGIIGRIEMVLRNDVRRKGGFLR
jgi:hypothetical protein